MEHAWVSCCQTSNRFHSLFGFFNSHGVGLVVAACSFQHSRTHLWIYIISSDTLVQSLRLYQQCLCICVLFWARFGLGIIFSFSLERTARFVTGNTPPAGKMKSIAFYPKSFLRCIQSFSSLISVYEYHYSTNYSLFAEMTFIRRYCCSFAYKDVIYFCGRQKMVL